MAASVAIRELIDQHGHELPERHKAALRSTANDLDHADRGRDASVPLDVETIDKKMMELTDLCDRLEKSEYATPEEVNRAVLAKREWTTDVYLPAHTVTGSRERVEMREAVAKREGGGRYAA